MASTACGNRMHYALFGALRLGVFIDFVLLAGVIGLLVQYRTLKIQYVDSKTAR